MLVMYITAYYELNSILYLTNTLPEIDEDRQRQESNGNGDEIWNQPQLEAALSKNKNLEAE